MKKIILDTNFLLIPVQLKVDIFSEFHRIMDQKYQLCVLEPSLVELKKLQKIAKTKTAANVAFQLIEKKDVTVLPSAEPYVDDAIVHYAEKEPVIVATRDKALMDSLRNQGTPVITLRQKKYLIFRP
ncbi:nucleotide-binding protein [Candidatus Woesearchaeota archaeon]|nr:nucleotide-binding protein [Candidatus Woesearchaeota archaeon]